MQLHSANQSTEQQDDEMDLLRLVALMWRGKWILILCALVGFGLARAYIEYIATPRYQATARMTFDPGSQNVVDLGDMLTGASSDDMSINTELQIIQSRAMLEALVLELDLHEDPEFNPAIRAISPWSREGIMNRLTELTGGTVQERRIATEENAVQRAVNVVGRAIDVSSGNRSRLIDISVTSTDRQKAATIANTLSDIYIRRQVEAKFSTVEYAVDWLSERVIELKEELRGQEAEIKTLRENADLVSAEALEVLAQRTRALEERFESAEASVERQREQVERLRTLFAEEDGPALLDAFADPTLRQIARRSEADTLMDDPSFVSRAELLLARAEGELERLRTQAAALQDSFAELEADLSRQSQALGQLTLLEQETAATQTLYETFLARLRETSLQIGLQQADSRVLSPAIPGNQVEPNVSRTTLLAVLLGILAGIGIIILRDLAQRGFLTSREIEQTTGGAVIGQIPVIPVRGRRQTITYLREKPTSAAAEAVRNLRTSLMLSNPDNPPAVMLVTSSIPGEGKTTVAVSLAMNLAALGKRVLLIEGDIRRRTLNLYFDNDDRRGMVSVLTGDAALDDVIHHDAESGLDLIMGEKAKANAADLFSSKSFGNLIQELRSRYDHVVIDTPPVLVVPDARVLAHHVDTLIYAIKWNSTDRAQVVEGLGQLRSIGATGIGLVLSQIDAKGMKRYGYGGRYGAYAAYGKGYYET